jgi:hypothetical protein
METSLKPNNDSVTLLGHPTVAPPNTRRGVVAYVPLAGSLNSAIVLSFPLRTYTLVAGTAVGVGVGGGVCPAERLGIGVGTGVAVGDGGSVGGGTGV